MNLFRTLISMLFVTNTYSQMLVGSERDEHGCVTDGGYMFCDTINRCYRPWEESCPPHDLLEDCSCPPPIPCPEPYMPEININNCKLNNHIDDCGCQTRCPSYDCSSPEIPDNCATWNDGCNTCQVRDGRAEICTMMYCFRQAEPYCMNYHIQSNSLNVNDICYRFCEDGSQESVNRRSDCPSGTVCKKINIFGIDVNFDSCRNNVLRCLSDH